MTPSALLSALRGRGFAVAATGGKLTVRPASALTTAEQAAIVTHLSGLVAAVATGVTPAVGDRDNDTAVRLLTDADTLVERLRVSGTRPEVNAAAAMVCRAYATGDLAAVRFAVAEFERVVRRLAGRPRVGAGAGHPPGA
ncbi:hypothetical protein [Urbifossiella limnaea]|uniref:TubC N-terminal docking domain-containing protein n=1 Tax=Urbifossiella limnaea TaxID=2528023 RepID=A0A517Y2G4_9BACT|nr:hypothetical protein [Urbifossiella limnaea]QDU23914.1 hypothetical protein ETAA1_59240 [Urbifossiella limnaea]